MKTIKVKKIRNRGRNEEYPAMRNVVTGAVYVDITLGDPRYQKVVAGGNNHWSQYVAFNIPGAWTTWNGEEPDCPLRHDIEFEFIP
jgi:hypothetical protein